VSLGEITDRHTSLSLYWKGVKENVIKTDLVAASTAVATDQAILQASFQTFAQVNRLRLLDFLR
jgi:flagellin-like hook-associated protein FlgL